jgi:hypothetical protein
LPVFESATAYPCIITYQKSAPNSDIKVTNVEHLKFPDLREYVSEHMINMSQSQLNDEGWNLVSSAESNLLAKLKNAGVPLKDYVKNQIYYGVKTGLNEAFVIDGPTREALIAADARSAEIIKPFLAGRDIKRYGTPVVSNYLIFTKRGIDINKYPAIKAHLEQFKKQLMPKPKDFAGDKWPGRKPGSYKWYEIQDAVDYYKEFDKVKIIFPDIAPFMQATIDTEYSYLGNTGYIIPTNDLYLLALLNSKIVHYIYRSVSSTIRGGYLRFIRQYVEKIPIIMGTEKQVATIIEIASIIINHKEDLKNTKLDNKRTQLSAKIDYLNEKIDKMVYEIYGLSEEEIGIVEGVSKV